MNIYKFCQGWDRKSGEEEETVEKIYAKVFNWL